MKDSVYIVFAGELSPDCVAAVFRSEQDAEEYMEFFPPETPRRCAELLVQRISHRF